jgi:6-phosphofructokinase 2
VIYTVTLNPAIDRILEVESLKPGEVNRVERESRYAGGKGIDVSRALKELGWESVALGFLGGYGGYELAGRLAMEGVACRFTPISQETRTNVIIHDRSRSTVTSVNARGPEVSPAELENFLSQLDYLYPPPTYLVCSGSIPPGVPVDIYRRLIEWANERKVRAVLDASGEPLREGLKASPFAIKPNRRELQELVGRSLASLEDVLGCAGEIRAQGVEVVLVSLGPEGLIGLSAEGAFHGQPPEVEVQSPVGAGDSAVAGFLIGQLKGFGLEASVRLAVAAGTAAVLTSGTELCRRQDVLRLEKLVTVKALG